MKIIKQGIKNGHIVKCDYCNSEIMYWDNEVEQECIEYTNIDKYFNINYIVCPCCKNKIKLNN